MMSKVFAAALLLMPGARASDMASMSPGEMLDFAQEIADKSTEEEHTILKTLLGDRATWHPDALSLIDDIDARAGSGPQSRRLNGIYCDGNTKATCEAQSDAQCNVCKWSGSSCGISTCSDYADQALCCANAKNMPAGCLWQTGSGGRCTENTCGSVVSRYDGFADAAAKMAGCSANSACTPMCGEGGADVECKEGKKADWECKCSNVAGNSFNSCNQAGGMLGGRRLVSERVLQGLLGGSSCTMSDCVKCLAPLGGAMSGTCDSKKTKVVTAGGECHEKCKTLAQCNEEVECMFCGPKTSTSCVKAQAVKASCAAITWGAVAPAATESCSAQCAVGTKCETCKGTPPVEFACSDPNAPAGGTVQTAGTPLAVMAGLFAAVLYRLY